MRELVVYDTNTFVSYLLSSKKTSAVCIAVASIFDETAVPVFSDETMAEYVRVLNYEKFDFLPEQINDLLDFVRSNGLYVVPHPTTVPFVDTTDKPFYDAAVAAGAWLVTGNKKHFPSADFIVSPREWLERTGL